MSRSDRKPRGSRPFVTLRGTLGVVVLVVVAAFSVFLLADAVARGAWKTVAVSLGGLGIAVWLVWWLVASPAVLVSREGVQSRGPFRERFAAWDDIADMSSSFLLSLTLRDGRRIVCFGAPSSGVDRPMGAGLLDARRGAPPAELVQVAHDFADDLTDPLPPSVTRSGWRWREAVIALALVVYTVVATAVVGPLG